MAKVFMHSECSVQDMDGNYICYLNPRLLDSQGIHKDKEGLIKFKRIKELHRTRHYVEKTMEVSTAPGILKQLGNVWTNIQYALQKEWGFQPDRKYHEFWTLPKCTCDAELNREGYPYSEPKIARGCPVHD